MPEGRNPKFEYINKKFEENKGLIMIRSPSAYIEGHTAQQRKDKRRSAKHHTER
jgi:hypothetical protein